MTNEKMTIHRALSELKIIDDRINKAIQNSQFCIANKHSNGKIGGKTLEEYASDVRASYDKATDLIRRRNAIKRGVVLSNARTEVKIGETVYTVAETIEMKNHGIEFKQTLLKKLETDYTKTQAAILQNNGIELEKRAEEYVIGLFGNKDSKQNVEDFERVKKEFVTQNTADFIDPVEIQKKIESLENEISIFMADVDAALSTSNAITEIEVSY